MVTQKFPQKYSQFVTNRILKFAFQVMQQIPKINKMYNQEKHSEIFSKVFSIRYNAMSRILKFVLHVMQ